MISAEYEFKENEKQKGSGILRGSTITYFYFINNQVLYYDLDRQTNDSFFNNQFKGIWQMYDTKSIKECNWGNYRIPNSGNLDVGVSEFSPNEKYLKYDWENYHKAYVERDEESFNREKEKWWR